MLEDVKRKSKGSQTEVKRNVGGCQKERGKRRGLKITKGKGKKY